MDIDYSTHSVGLTAEAFKEAITAIDPYIDRALYALVFGSRVYVYLESIVIPRYEHGFLGFTGIPYFLVFSVGCNFNKIF